MTDIAAGDRPGRQTGEGAGTRPGTPSGDQPGDLSTLTFDQALAELQRTVGELEQGGLPLERSIALYEQGVALHERCAGLLSEAELRVQRLLERASGAIEAVDASADEEATP